LNNRPRRTLPWLALGFCSGLAAVVVALAHRGRGETGVALAVVLAGRTAFVFFFPAYAGGALSRLGAWPVFATIARHGREAGLAFAGALAVHLSMLAWLFAVAEKPPAGDTVIVTFGLGAMWTLALTLSSLEQYGRVFATEPGRAFRILGMEYIAALFLYDFVISPLATGFSHKLQYAPFALLIVVGPLMRLAAWLRHGPGVRRYSPHLR